MSMHLHHLQLPSADCRRCAAAVTLLLSLLVTAGARSETSDIGDTPLAQGPSESAAVYSMSQPPATPPSSPGTGSESPQDLADYLALAALHNPGLQAAFERWQADLEQVQQTSGWPDPRFNFGYYIREVETRVGPQQMGFGLSQVFPWFGKLEARGDVAFQASEASRRRYEAAKLRLYYRVKDAYYEFYYLRRATEITRGNLQLLTDLERIARVRYRTASTGQPDVIKAQVELGRLEDRLAALEEMREPLGARLQTLLNLPVDAALPWPATPAWRPTATTDAEVLAWVRENNPELLALAHETRSEEHAIALAGKAGYPDFTLGLSYIVTGNALDPGIPDSGKDPVIAGVSVNLPIFRGKYRAAEREAQARLRASQFAHADRTKELESVVKQVLFETRDAERRVSLYRDTLIPKGRQSLQSAETAFMAGHTDFLNVIDAQRVLLEFELAFDRALSHHAQRVAELEMYAGRMIPLAESKP